MASVKVSRRDAHRLLAGLCALPSATSLWADTPVATNTPAARLPTEAFAQLPMLSGLALSPDGKHLAGLVNLENDTVLVTRAVASGSQMVSLLKSDNQRFFFNWVKWTSDDRLVASVRYAAVRGNGIGTQETRLISVKRDGSALMHLNLKADRGGEISATSLQVQDNVVDWLPEDGKNVLLALGEGNEGWPAIYKLDLTTGMRSGVHGAKRGVYAWMLDRNHQVRIGVARNGGRFDIIERSSPSANWRTLWSFERDSQATAWPLGFGKDPQELWIQAWHQGHLAVFSVDLANPALPRTLRLAKAGTDMDAGLMRSPRSGEIVGLRMTTESGSDDARDALWDPELKALALMIDQQLPGRFNRLLSFSDDEQSYLLHSSGNGRPGQYFVGHRARGELALLGETYPRLPTTQLTGKQTVRIFARDGLPLNAFISQPRGAAPGKPLPLVLLPHGGPHSRDDVDFDSWTEFLTNRGYRVLQVNFRGSDGGGLKHKLAGMQRWGLEMQDDLTDAVQWAVAQHLADPQRLAIVGASYGGYAALMGAVKTPTLYRCAISFAGVCNLLDLVFEESDYIGGAAAVEAQIGSVWGDSERLRATSPALQADRIQAPVLLVHGSVDRVVPVSHSQGMAAALSRAGKLHRYVEQEGGDHHLSRYSHRLEFFKLMEAFLAQHIGQAV
nr:prolyl oligopeptidase family serine peptidase [uncultured Albidiferax sp.]